MRGRYKGKLIAKHLTFFARVKASAYCLPLEGKVGAERSDEVVLRFDECFLCEESGGLYVPYHDKTDIKGAAPPHSSPDGDTFPSRGKQYALF